MSRYINADALYKALEKIYYCEMYPGEMRDSSILITFRTVCRQIDSIPTADVVEVIRCKDCANWQIDWIPTIGGDKGCHYCEMFDSSTEPFNYCGYAKRREDNEI